MSAAAADEGPQLDGTLFFRRLNSLYDTWKTNSSHDYWGPDMDAFCILSGKSSGNEATYRKSAVIQMYLLGYLEFPDTIMVFTQDTLWVLTSGKKYSLLESIKNENVNSKVKLELLKKDKSDGNAKNYETLVEKLKASKQGVKIGMLLKESPTGDLCEGFKKALEKAEFETVEVSKALELCTGMKEDVELENIRWAAALSSKIFKKKFIEDMETIIDEEKKVSHTKMAQDIESVFEDPSQIKVALSVNDIESCYAPIIQSGGEYNLKASAQSNSENLKYDVITCSLGARYKGYCSNVGRTYFIDPTKSMEKTYDILLEAHEMCIAALRPGVAIEKVVQKVRKHIEARNSKLLEHLTKNLGFGIGLEFRESTNLLSAKNPTKVQVGMAFNVAFGFANVPVPASQQRKGGLKEFSVFLADTVVVLDQETQCYTKVNKNWAKVHYDIRDEDEEGDDEDSKKKSDSIHGAVDTTISGTRNQLLQSRLRDQQRQLEGKETDQERRDRHQAELMKRKREEAIIRLEQRQKEDDTEGASVKEIKAYKSSLDYPKQGMGRQLAVDMRNEAVLVPVNGIPVPFHISTIKSVSKSEEEKATYLRINFFTPGASVGKDCSPSMQAMIQQNGKSMFIKELGFRSVDAHNLNMQFRLIKELQKRIKQRVQQQEEEHDLVEQEDLIITRDRKVPRLSDLSARPHLSGRKSQGTLEAHSNGLRFKSLKGERLDILYSNIKHAIFQPCDNELVVLIHFYLKNPIMIGKKKHQNVQFFTEVMEASQNLDNRRRSMYDPDELDEENRERALRSKLNQTFKEFCRKVEATSERVQSSFSFDIPYRELGFQGSPFKDMVTLLPTVNCLVNLTENPAFIVALDEIEHVHFERVMFSAKNFDLVIVLKNFDKPPYRISAIPMTELESIKEWIDDIDLCFTTGTANLNWKSIMAAIKSDDRFYLDTDEDGVSKPAGWEFLRMEGSDDDDDDEEDNESNFSDEMESEESEESEESDESDYESLVDESESEEEEEEEDAPSWEDLEEEARASDRMRGEGGGLPEKKRKSGGGGGGSRDKKKRRR